MDHYIDIRLRPDPEFPAQVLLNALYAKLHKALVALATNSIGVSFPAHTNRHLGDVLRLHGSSEDLTALQALPWLGAMGEMVQTSPIAPVPATAQYRMVSRVQVQSNLERVKRRLVKRLMAGKGGIANDSPYKAQVVQAQSTHSMHQEEAEKFVQNALQAKAANKTNAPFVAMQSSSTGGHHFRLFIRHGPMQTQAQTGSFNAYGLSASATVPWF